MMSEELGISPSVPAEQMPSFLAARPDRPVQPSADTPVIVDAASAAVLSQMAAPSALRMQVASERSPGGTSLSGAYQLTSRAGMTLLGVSVASTLVLAFAPGEWGFVRTVALAVCMFASGMMAAHKARIWERIDAAKNGSTS